MAKQSFGILDGYRGTVGTVIGYQWRGRWCLRARPRFVHNPRTEAQQEHRMLFRDMVRLAGRMKEVLRIGMHTASLDEHMTECNLFVKLNKRLFTPTGVDYNALEISRGPVAPVVFGAAEVDEHNVVSVAFEKNPLHARTDAYDRVYLYAWCPSMEAGQLSVPAYRHSRRVAMALPDEWAGREVFFYGFVQDCAGRTSASQKIVLKTVQQTSEGEEEESARRMPSSHVEVERGLSDYQLSDDGGGGEAEEVDAGG